MKNKGITLIALIITIIVMLILVAVTISMAINGELFSYAGKATTDTKLAKLEEQLWQEYMSQKMADYSNGTDNASMETAVDNINEKGEYNIAKIPEGGITDITLSSNSIIIGTDDDTKTEVIIVDFEGEEGDNQYFAVIGGKYYRIDFNNDGKIEIEKEASEMSGGSGETNELSITLANTNLATTEIEGNQITVTGSKTSGETTFTVSYGNIEKSGTLIAKSGMLERTLDGAMWLGSNFTAGTTITNVTTSDSNVAQVIQLSDNTYSLKCNSEEGTALVTATTASETLEFKIKSTAKIVYPTNGNTNTANTTITGATTGYGTNNPLIPKGFYAINTKDAKWVDNNGNSVVSSNVDKGLAIMDANGNQFVWVPVPILPTDTPPDDTNQTCQIAQMERTEWSTSDGSTSAPGSSNKEPYSSGYTGEKTDWYNMMKSVYNYGGFYVGRFVAGTTTKRTSGTPGTSNVIVQQDAYPYNYVVWGTAMNNYINEYKDLEAETPYDYGYGALYLSKDKYSSESFGVTSTLIYGSQWDAMLKWINDDTHRVWNSTNWGNHRDNSSIIKRGAYDSSSMTPVRISYTKNSGYEVLLTTGASNNFKAKNIYDVAGNCWERTMESAYTSGRISRGGGFSSQGNQGAMRYNSGYKVIQDYISFRITLYL